MKAGGSLRLRLAPCQNHGSPHRRRLRARRERFSPPSRGSGQGTRSTACFFARIRAWREHQIAAVAVARKLTMRCSLLAFVDEGRRLPVGPAGAGRQQDPRDTPSSRTSTTERQQAWTSLCLQHQGAARLRDVDCRPGGAKLRRIRVAMESAAAENRRAGASVRQDKIGGLATLAADASRFATRSPAPNKNNRS